MFEEAAHEETVDTGWGHVASHDGAPAVIDAILRLDTDATYTKTELSDEAGVPLKTLYLDGTLDHLVEMGFLEKEVTEGEEVRFGVDTETSVYRAAVAFDDAIADRLASEE
ncbi:hypothetical protein EGH21_16105 [Halomicroarcula sp. F13]|uniref:Transcriptional regulator n=1 Tax=Haloarcula rubra TaxID=2487747 RepID=A0AAW4PW19_9EURY|nr:hypothetical protein [Halomicroarcula rubra]MBX0324553.1 hypothetical protein [Halomicroarcula rubra]